MKAYPYKGILNKEFKPSQQVLLCISWLKIFLRKLRAPPLPTLIIPPSHAQPKLDTTQQPKHYCRWPWIVVAARTLTWSWQQVWAVWCHSQWRMMVLDDRKRERVGEKYVSSFLERKALSMPTRLQMASLMTFLNVSWGINFFQRW